MDQWFLQLFDLINRQKDTRKVEMLLPELYIEFDILARLENKEGLKDIYYHLASNDPFNTEDKTYNKNGYIKLKKEILKRLVMLNDLTIIEDEANELILKDDKKAINRMINNWKDNTYIHAYLKEYFEKYSLEEVKKTIPKKKEVIEPIEEKVEEPIKEEPVKKEVILEANPMKVEEFKVEKPKGKPAIIQPKKVKEKTETDDILYQEKPQVEEKEIPKKKEKAIKEETPKSKEIIKEKTIDRKPETKAPKPTETKKIIKEEKPVEKKKKTEKKPSIEEHIEPIEKPTKIYEKNFVGLMQLLIDKYNLRVNMNMLNTSRDPRPNFYRILAEFIDSTDRNSLFFIDLFKILKEYQEDNLISYIAGKSNWLKKLCTMNIGLINENDIQNKFKLLEYLKDEEYDFIEITFLEKQLRIYIDNLPDNNKMSGRIYGHASEVSKFAPKLIDEASVYDSIDFFNKKVMPLKNDIDSTNPTELYWSIILATSLTIYCQRYKDYDFTNSINCIKGFSIKLINLTDNQELRDSMVVLFKNYIRNIYKAGTKVPDYEKWWKGQRDSMLDAKLDAIGELNLID